MRLTCPSCAAVYEVPDASLRPGRRTRCAQCGAMWIPLREEPPPSPAAEPEPATGAEPAPPPGPLSEPFRPVLAAGAASPGLVSTAMQRLAAAHPSRPSAALRAAWAASILLLIGSAAAAYAWRGSVVAVWPASAWVLGSAASAHPPAGSAEPPAAAVEPHVRTAH